MTTVRFPVVAVVALLFVTFADVAGAQNPPVRDRMLSNQVTKTYWAHAETRARMHVAPDASSRRIGRLHLDTEDGLPEVYIALRRFVDDDGRPWIKVRIPARSGPPRAWVRASDLSRLRLNRDRLVVDKRRLRATFFQRGRAVWRTRVGIGKRGTPTPAGRFWIREGFPVRGGGGGMYGPYAFGTSAYSVLSDWPGGGVIGIHGTNQPGLIPGRPSHGCIRMRNRAILWLSRHLRVGTPVRIR